MPHAGEPEPYGSVWIYLAAAWLHDSHDPSVDMLYTAVLLVLRNAVSLDGRHSILDRQNPVEDESATDTEQDYATCFRLSTFAQASRGKRLKYDGVTLTLDQGEHADSFDRYLDVAACRQHSQNFFEKDVVADYQFLHIHKYRNNKVKILA